MSLSRLRLLYIKQLVEEETDKTHGLTLKQIGDHLRDEKGITANDKTLQADMRALKDYYDAAQMELVTPSGKDHTYRLCGVEKEFTFQERLFLTDAVQTAKFLSEKQAKTLLTKIGGSHGERFRNKVRLANHARMPDGEVWESVLTIQNAIQQDVQIRFRYFTYGVNKKKVYRNNEKDFIVNPFSMVYSNGMYYLLAIVTREKKVTVFRIDKMEMVEMRTVPRRGKEVFDRIELGDYTKAVFGMNMGDDEGVPILTTMRFENHLVDEILEHFGHDTFIVPVDNNHFKVTVPVVESPQFFSWFAQFGIAATFESSNATRAHFMRYIASILAAYERKGEIMYYRAQGDMLRRRGVFKNHPQKP